MTRYDDGSRTELYRRAASAAKNALINCALAFGSDPKLLRGETVLPIVRERIERALRDQHLELLPSSAQSAGRGLRPEETAP